MHLTLKFGGGDHQKAKYLTLKFAEVEHPNFTITITDIGYFPEGGQPNVIWTGIKENGSLVGLHQKVESACNEVGIAPEN